jgi:hypothetical protein
MQVPGSDAHICVTRGIANLRQRSTASQGVADNGVPAMTDGERA